MTGDAVTVTAYVAVPPAEAFAVFTEDIDLWWRRGPRFRAGGQWPSTIRLEPRLGGRVFEELAAPAPVLREIGAITSWEPPGHLALAWRVGAQTTTVDIRFTARGDGTEVTVVHAGWAAIADDAQVRHGRTGTAYVHELGRWWAGLLASLRVTSSERASRP